ncbi:hypothetical protein BCON_0031g00130 [Botryotinia convoluta]|uniref:Uncharacterized protein n=1 Tax=Botryotinia convoluta TaxID=54673 RepID=A0A4Z1IHV5_9HELO|nr:hypothetical protein BCON_0031g00130 [Botryotinia convoluta]
MENSIKGIDHMVTKIIDEGVFALDTDNTFSFGSMRVLCQNYKEESEKNINEIRKRNEEMIWKTREWRAERIKAAMKFEKMGRMLALVDTTGRGFGDDV